MKINRATAWEKEVLRTTKRMDGGREKKSEIILKPGRVVRLEAGLKFGQKFFILRKNQRSDASPPLPTGAIRIRRRSFTPYGPLTI